MAQNTEASDDSKPKERANIVGKKSLDYCKWEDLDFESDEDDCHPNIEIGTWRRLKERMRREKGIKKKEAYLAPKSKDKKLNSKKKKSKKKQRFIPTKIIPGLSIDSYDEAPLNSDNSSFKFVYESNVINGINNISNILNDDNKSTKDIDFEETEIKLTPKQLHKQSTKRSLTIIDMISLCLERSNGIHILRNIKNLGRAHQRFKDLEPFLNKKIKTGQINRKQKERVITMVKWIIKILQNENPDKGFVLESFYQQSNT
eukprot:255284_1